MVDRLSLQSKPASFLRAAAGVLFLRITGAALSFIYTVAIARQLGANDAGQYFFAFSLVMFLSTLARIGLDNAVLRYTSIAVDQENWIGVRRIFRTVIGVVAMLSFAIAVPVVFFAPQISTGMWNSTGSASMLRLLAVSIVPFSLMTILSEFLRASGKLTASVLVSSILHLATGLILLTPLVREFGPSGAALTFSVATTISASVGIYWWRQGVIHRPMTGHTIPLGPLLDSAKHLFVIALAGQAVIVYAPTILIGVWGTAKDVAVFSVANRIGMIVGLMLVAANIVVAPRFAKLYERRDLKRLGEVGRSISVVLAIAAALIVLFGIMFSKSLMGIFGEDFRTGGTVLTVILAGQFINVATGSVGMLMMMTGQERRFKQLILTSSGVLIVLCFLLIPQFGGIGAAVAIAVSTAILNLSALYIAQQWLGIQVGPLPITGKTKR